MIEIGPMRFVWDWPGWGWRMYGVIWRKSDAFVGVSRKIADAHVRHVSTEFGYVDYRTKIRQEAKDRL